MSRPIMIASELIPMLCCPKTRQRLEQAGPELIRTLNEKISAGSVKNNIGQLVTEKLETALITADGKYLYPVRQSIPVMLWDEAVPAECATG